MNKNQMDLEAKDKEIKAKKIKAKKIELQKRFRIRSFKTTTESIIFTRRMAKAISSIKNSPQEFEDQDVSELFDLFDPDLIKYVIENFVSLKAKKNFVYEKEFINDFETLMMVFAMAVEHLTKKANGEGKSQTPSNENKIQSSKRDLNS